jgi:hypothetical protein
MNLDSLLNIAFLVLLVYYCEVVRFNINYMTYMMLVYHFVCLTLLVLTTRTNEDPNSISTMRLIIIATKSILTLQIVFGMLKWTNTILWSWYQSFVIFWLGFGKALPSSRDNNLVRALLNGRHGPQMDASQRGFKY